MADTVSAHIARTAAQPGAAQPHTHQHEPPMHDSTDTRPPATAQAYPPFAGPPSSRLRAPQERHGHPDRHRAAQQPRTARTAPLSHDLGQPADDEPSGEPVMPAIAWMRA